VFWRLVRQGLSPSASAVAVGVSETAGKRWFRDAGGMIPSIVDEPSGYRLSAAEREEIAVMRAQGIPQVQIARSLGRHPSTICRELARDKGRRRSGYRARHGQADAEAKAKRPKLCKVSAHPPLEAEVLARIRLNHSPVQIAASLRRDFPDDERMQASHEAIYHALYVQGRGEFRRELASHLRTGRVLRKPRARVLGLRRGTIPGMINISQRPAEADDRVVPGHWEGDLIIGKDGKSAIGTLVERSTRFVMLLHLPRGHTALEVQQALVAKIKDLPELLRRSLTWDQGSEMANHAQITLETGLAIYFCDPHSPWQRGSNENTNGLLRQYFPKGTDLSVHGPGILDLVATELNQRPRQTLNWKTPAQALNKLLSQHGEQPLR